MIEQPANDVSPVVLLSGATKRNILVSGLGGGLDVHNAMLLFTLLKQGQKEKVEDFNYEIGNVYLGSVRPIVQSDIENPVDTLISPHVTVINGESKVTKKGRYFEPTLTKETGEQIIMMSGSHDKTKEIDHSGIQNLKEGIKAVVQKYELTDIIFVDGGGDSLILSAEDCIDKYHGSVFIGGDAVVLSALHKLSHELPGLNIVQGIISVGLDVNRKAFKNNIKELSQRNGYFGRINFTSGKAVDTRNHTNSFMNALTRYVFGNDRIRNDTLQEFFRLSEKYLVLTLEQSQQYNKEWNQNSQTSRFISHTAVVTYHALKENFGIQRTFVPWEPKLKEGKGVDVEVDHQWLYLVNPAIAEEIKIERNK